MKKPISPRKRLKARKETKAQRAGSKGSNVLVKKDLYSNFEVEKSKRVKLPSTKYSHREIAGKFTHHALSIALPVTVYTLGLSSTFGG
jgi:hypothetical protein